MTLEEIINLIQNGIICGFLGLSLGCLWGCILWDSEVLE